MSWARWITVAGVPVIVCLLVLVSETGFRNWAALPRPILFGTVVDTLLIDTVLMILGAPLAGVALSSRWRLRAGITGGDNARVERSGLGLFAPLLALIASFVAASAALSLAGWGTSAEAVRAIVTSHLTLAAGALALSAFGAWCGVTFRHPLDAAACSLALALLASGAIIVAGPVVTDAPGPIVAAGLLASPLVTTAAAADIDLFRTDVLYQISPLAHIRLEYPAWQAAAGLYLLVALACFGSLARTVRSPIPTSD